jgi:AbrB family transcriptional regulator (stage V sporulation protein T)
MKATGLIRRIDDLGRIVIPKETRRSLRIKSGEPLEIFVEDEMIILKKYSSMNGLEDLSQNYADTISSLTKRNVIITDRDNIIAVGGSLKKKYNSKLISKYIENLINNRKSILQKEKKVIELTPEDKEEASYAISTIIVNGDAIGLIIIFSLESEITEVEEKILNIATNFIGKIIEE